MTVIIFTLAELNTAVIPGLAYFHIDHTVVGDATAILDASVNNFDNLFVFATPASTFATVDISNCYFGLNYANHTTCIFPEFVGSTTVASGQFGTAVLPVVAVDYLQYLVYAMYAQSTLSSVLNEAEYVTLFNYNAQEQLNISLEHIAGVSTVPIGTTAVPISTSNLSYIYGSCWQKAPTSAITSNVSYNVFDQISTTDPGRLSTLVKVVSPTNTSLTSMLPVGYSIYTLPITVGDTIMFKLTVNPNSNQFVAGSVPPKSYIIRIAVTA